MKINFLPIKLAFAISLALVDIAITQIASLAAPKNSTASPEVNSNTSNPPTSEKKPAKERENKSPNNNLKLPQAPNTGTPVGDSTPGGTRNPVKFSCPNTKQSLTALVANNGKDFTSLEHFNLWVYIPYTQEQIEYMEFALKDSQKFKTVYRTAVKLTANPGTIKISIPNDPKYALEVGKNYSWDFMLYCRADKISEPDLILKGWVRRVENDDLSANVKSLEGKYTSYLEKDIWYDAIDYLATQHFADPQNPELSAAWNNLLRFLGKEELNKEPFANSVLLPPID
jgi:Domain of Unknown Function (DUF928)